MKIDEFDAAVDAIEIDPRPRLKRIVAVLLAAELSDSALTDDQRSRFAKPALAELLTGAKASIEAGNVTALDSHLTEFRTALRRVIQWQRDFGELKPVTPASEIQRSADRLRKRLYFGPEVTALGSLMKDGERITEIEWRQIKTDHQVITRALLASATRPVTFRDGNQWRSQFISESRIAEAIEEEHRRAQPIRGSGPSAWIE